MVVDATASEAQPRHVQRLARGVHVVTANKLGVVRSWHARRPLPSVAQTRVRATATAALPSAPACRC